MNYLNLKDDKEKGGVPKYVWIAVTVLIGYLIISSLLDRIEEKRLMMKYEAIGAELGSALEKSVKIMNKSMEQLQEIPKIKIPQPTQDNQKIIIQQPNYNSQIVPPQQPNKEKQNEKIESTKKVEEPKQKSIKIEMH